NRITALITPSVKRCGTLRTLIEGLFRRFKHARHLTADRFWIANTAVNQTHERQAIQTKRVGWADLGRRVTSQARSRCHTLSTSRTKTPHLCQPRMSPSPINSTQQRLTSPHSNSALSHSAHAASYRPPDKTLRSEERRVGKECKV